MRHLTTSLLTLAIAASPALASAQQVAEPAPAPVTAPAPDTTRSIMYADAAAGARPVTTQPAVDRAAAATDAVRMERHVGAGKNAALMIVGAAAIVTGIAVGGGSGAAIAIGGAALGLYGLYNFLK